MRIRAASSDPPAPGSLPSDLRAREPEEVRRAVAAELERMEPARDVLVWRVDEVLDVDGWDADKALRLLRGSNPSLFEWLASPIVYAEDPAFAVVRELAAECFSPVASAHHYLSMGRNHLAALAGETVRLKKCLYTMRAILAARWVVAERASAPMLFATWSTWSRQRRCPGSASTRPSSPWSAPRHGAGGRASEGGRLRIGRRGRPPVGDGPSTVVPVRFDAATLAALNARAQAEGIQNRSEAIRAAVRAWAHIA